MWEKPAGPGPQGCARRAGPGCPRAPRSPLGQGWWGEKEEHCIYLQPKLGAGRGETSRRYLLPFLPADDEQG